MQAGTGMIHRFNQINNEIGALYHKVSQKMGFADSEFNILYMLCDEGEGIDQSHIIEVTGMSKQTVHSAVRRLEQDEIVVLGSRTAHRKAILLSEKGRALIEEKFRPFMDIEESIYNSWTEEEKELFLALNRRYAESLDRIVEGM